MTNKIDIITGAYSQMRISGLTVDPTPEDKELALDRLEDMMWEFFSRNVDVNYNFEEDPDPNSITNVPRIFWQMMKTNLATRLIPDFNKIVPPTLVMQASQSFENASAYTAAQNAREVQYPRRMARGSGNTLRFNRWQRFQRPERLPPNASSTNRLLKDEINDYQESFVAYLESGETIDSFTIVADPGLQLISSANNDPIIDYRVKGRDNSTQGIWQQVKITVTTSLGRVEIRLINFEVTDSNTVGSEVT